MNCFRTLNVITARLYTAANDSTDYPSVIPTCHIHMRQSLYEEEKILRWPMHNSNLRNIDNGTSASCFCCIWKGAPKHYHWWSLKKVIYIYIYIYLNCAVACGSNRAKQWRMETLLSVNGVNMGYVIIVITIIITIIVIVVIVIRKYTICAMFFYSISQNKITIW